MFVLEHSRRRGASAHGTHASVDRTGAVRHAADSLRVPSLDNARISVTFGSAGDVNLVAFFEHVAGQFLSERVACTVCETEFTKVLFDSHARFLEVSGNGFVDSCFLDSAKADLNRFVAIVLFRLYLHDRTGTRFDNRHGDHFAFRSKDLAHADFLTDDCFIHVKFILLLFTLRA